MLKKWLDKKEENEFLPSLLEITENPPSPLGKALLWTFIVFIVGALLWLIFGKVDEVAVASGKVIPQGQVKVIQVEDKGTVKNIYVQDGQKVKQGEILAELDPTVSEAELAQIKKKVAYYELEIERLTAEKVGLPFQPVPKQELELKDIAFQQSLYASRRTGYEVKLSAAQAATQQASAALEAAKVNKNKYEQLHTINSEKEKRLQQLMKEDAIAYFTFLDQQAKSQEVWQTLVAQDSEIARMAATVLQNQQNEQNVTAEYFRDIDTNLVEDRKQLLTYQEELKKAQEKQSFAQLIAPVDGVVTQLSVHTIGAVVTTAQPLMVIVPDGVAMEVEGWVANKDIGFVQKNQTAEIKIETFNFQKYGTLTGIVQEVSADAVEDKEKGRVYRAVISLDQDHVKIHEKPVYISPGMSAQVEIKIRQKRVIDFFLEPFQKYQSEAFRER